MTRHRIDLFSLVSGLFFVGVSVLALVGGVALDAARWVWPTVLVAAGVIVLVTAFAGTRERPTGAATTTDDDRGTAADDPVMAAARRDVDAADHTTPHPPLEGWSDDAHDADPGDLPHTD